MQVSHKLDLKAFDSWQYEVQSVPYGKTKEVSKLHALDWKFELLADSVVG